MYRASRCGWMTAALLAGAGLAAGCDALARWQCESAGGVWDTWGLSPIPACNYRTSDAGTPCTDSSQCEGSCIGWIEECDQGSAGVCSDYRATFGCHCFLHEAGGNEPLCAD